MKYIITTLFSISVLTVLAGTPTDVFASEIIIKSVDKKSDQPMIVEESSVGSVLMNNDDVILFEKRNRGSKFRTFDDSKNRWKSVTLPRETNIKDWSIDYQIIPLKKKNEALALYISNTNPDVMYLNMWDGKRWMKTKEIALPSTCADSRFDKYIESHQNVFLELHCNQFQTNAVIELISIDKDSGEVIDMYEVNNNFTEFGEQYGNKYRGQRVYIFPINFHNEIIYWVYERGLATPSTLHKLKVNSDGQFGDLEYYDPITLSMGNFSSPPFYQDKKHIIIGGDPTIYQSRYKSISIAPDSIPGESYNKKIGLIAALDTLSSEIENYYYISHLEKNGFSDAFATISRGKGAYLIYFDKISESPLQYMLTTYRNGTNHKIQSTIFDETGNIISDWDVFGDSPFGVSRAAGTVLSVDDKLLFLRGNQYVYGSPDDWSEVKKIFPEGASHLKYLTQYTNKEGQHVFIFSRKIIHEDGTRYFFIYAALFDLNTGDFTISNQLTREIYNYSIYQWNVSVSQNKSNALVEIGDDRNDFRYLQRFYTNN